MFGACNEESCRAGCLLVVVVGLRLSFVYPLVVGEESKSEAGLEGITSCV